MKRKFWTYAASIGLALGVGVLSALLTGGDMDIYPELVRPPLAPPAWLFPLAWTVLYILMGAGAARVYLLRGENPSAARSGLRLYAAQLAVNFLWSGIFFSLRAFLAAFLWLLLLLGLVAAMKARFSDVSRAAALMQLPYVLWLLFAAYLNFAIYLLN